MPSLSDIAQAMRDDLDAGRLQPAEAYQARLPERALEVGAIHAQLAGSAGTPSPGADGSSLEQATRSVVGLDTLTDPTHPRHTVQGEIARGGMGVVFAARDEILRRDLAIKKVVTDTVPGSAEGSPTATPVQDLPLLVRRLMEEAQVTAQLDHTGVVPVHELGVDDEGHVFFTMKRVRGRTLAEVFDLVRERRGGWSMSRALQVFLKICDTLAYAHGKGVIHRDLKPANVMVGTYGEVFVMDWGLAKVKGDAAGASADAPADEGEAPRSLVITDQAELARLREDAALTMHGDVLGTLGYMPPEQASGDLDRLDERSDLWSLGAMLYELFAGLAPYCDGPEGRSLRGILLRYANGRPTPLTDLAPDTPPELVSIIEHAMAHEPEQRFASARELASEIHAYLDGRVVRSHRTGVWIELRKWIARNRLAAASVLAGVLLLAGGVTAFAWQQRRAAVRIGQERDVAEAERLRSEGLRLAALSELARDRSPAHALELALRAAELLPGEATRNALLGALRVHRLRDHLAGHEGYVTFGAFAGPDRLVTADSTGLVIVWDTAAGRAVHWLDSPHGEVQALALDAARRRAAVSYADGNLLVWDVERGEERARLQGEITAANPVVALAWTAPDEVALGRAGGRVELCDAARGTVTSTLLPDGAAAKVRPRMVAPSSGGPDLVVMDAAGGVHRLDAAARAVRWSLPPAGRREVTRGVLPYVAVDPTGTCVVVARPGDGVRSIAFEDGAVLQTLREAAAGDGGCLLAPDGHHLACVEEVSDGLGGRTERLAQFERSADGRAFERVGTIAWRNPEWPMAFDPEGELLIAGGLHDARVVHYATGREAYPLRGHNYGLNEARFSDDGRLVATLNDDRIVRLWSALLPGEMRGLTSYRHRGWRVVARTSDFARALLAERTPEGPGRLAWVDAATGASAWTLPPGLDVKDGVLATGDERLVLWVEGGRLVTLDARDGTRVTDVAIAGWSDALAKSGGVVSPDGARFVLVTQPPRVHDTRRGDLVCELDTGGMPPGRPSWSPDSTRLIMAHSGEGAFGIYDATSGSRQTELRGHVGWALHGIWMPGGRVATVARDASVRTWDALTGRQIGMAASLPMRGNTIDVSHDGGLLAFLSTELYLLDATGAPTVPVVATLRRDDLATSLHFDPAAPRFFTEDSDGGVRTWWLDAVQQARALRARGFDDMPAGVRPARREPTDAPPDPLALSTAAERAIAAGDAEAAEALLARAETLRPHWSRPAFLRALLHAHAGRREETLAELEEAFARGWPRQIGAWTFLQDPAFSFLHDEPRFEALASTLRVH